MIELAVGYDIEHFVFYHVEVFVYKHILSVINQISIFISCFYLISYIITGENNTTDNICADCPCASQIIVIP